MKQKIHIILLILISLSFFSQENYAQTKHSWNLVDSIWVNIQDSIKHNSVSDKYLYKCYELAKECHYYKRQLEGIDLILTRYNKSDTIAKYLPIIKECSEKTGDYFIYSQSLVNMICIDANNSKVVESKKYLLQLNKIAAKSKDNNIKLMNKIAVFLYDVGLQKDPERCFQDIKSAYQLINDTTNLNNKSSIYQNLILRSVNYELDQSYKYAKEYEEIINKEFGITKDSIYNPFSINYITSYVGYLYYYLNYKKDTKKAKECLDVLNQVSLYNNHSMDFYDRYTLNYAKIEYYTHVGDELKAKGDIAYKIEYRTVVELYKILAEDVKKYSPPLYSQIEKNIISYLRKLGDEDQALVEYRKYMTVQDSINSNIVINEYNALQSEYHLKDIIKERNSTSIKFLYAIILVLIIMLIVLAISIIFIRRDRNLLRKINEQKEIYNKRVLKSIHSKENLQKEINIAINIPLGKLVSNIEQITDNKSLSLESKKKINTLIKFNANLLLDYVNDILMFSRLESNKIIYKRQRVEIIPIIENAIEYANKKSNNSARINFESFTSKQKYYIDEIMFKKVLERLFIYYDENNIIFPIFVKLNFNKAKNILYLIIKGSPLSEIKDDVYINVKNELNMHYQDAFNEEYHILPGNQKGKSIIQLTFKGS